MEVLLVGYAYDSDREGATLGCMVCQSRWKKERRLRRFLFWEETAGAGTPLLLLLVLLADASCWTVPFSASSMSSQNERLGLLLNLRCLEAWRELMVAGILPQNATCWLVLLGDRKVCAWTGEISRSSAQREKSSPLWQWSGHPSYIAECALVRAGATMTSVHEERTRLSLTLLTSFTKSGQRRCDRFACVLSACNHHRQVKIIQSVALYLR